MDLIDKGRIRIIDMSPIYYITPSDYLYKIANAIMAYLKERFKKWAYLNVAAAWGFPDGIAIEKGETKTRRKLTELYINATKHIDRRTVSDIKVYINEFVKLAREHLEEDAYILILMYPGSAHIYYLRMRSRLFW